MARLPDGTLDYENPDTLDLPLIKQCLRELSETGKTVLPIYDFTGVIGISGERQGCVYFTAHRDLLRQLLLHVGEADVSDNNLCDLVGEIANTISGNARRHFGPNFMISVPVVVAGNARAIQVPKDIKAYILPLKWHKLEAAMIASLR